MRYLEKQPDRDFVILNLTDPQISTGDLETKNTAYTTMTGTVRQLVEEVQPDLITVTGDFTYGGSDSVYAFYAEFLSSFGIPWTAVWGNHDNQAGAEPIARAAAVFMKQPLCCFEEGDLSLGSGNYVIGIREGDRLAEGLIFMDTHDREPYGDKTGWGKLLPSQLDWYEAQVKNLRELGCTESTIFQHIPIYSYREAVKAAYRVRPNGKAASISESYGRTAWNEGYEESFGVMWEGIGSYPADEGALDVIVRNGHTKYMIVGHEHVNNFAITYRGVCLTYALKTGSGCYWNEKLNGGTVLKIGSNGINDLYHVYIDPKPFV